MEPPATTSVATSCRCSSIPAGCSILDALQHDLGVEGTWPETVVAAKTEVLRDVLGARPQPGDRGVRQSLREPPPPPRPHPTRATPRTRAVRLPTSTSTAPTSTGTGSSRPPSERRRIEAAVKAASPTTPASTTSYSVSSVPFLCGDVDGSDADDLRARFEQLSATGDGEGSRGHGALPLGAVAGDGRGRHRPGWQRDRRVDLPRTGPGTGPALPRTDAHDRAHTTASAART